MSFWYNPQIFCKDQQLRNWHGLHSPVGQPLGFAAAPGAETGFQNQGGITKYTICQGVFLILTNFLSGVLQCICFDLKSDVAVIAKGKTYIC